MADAAGFERVASSTNIFCAGRSTSPAAPLTHGNHPFGAILVDQNRNVLIEAENGYMPAHDGTAHAERLLATQACTTLSPDMLGKPRCIRRPNPARCARARSTGPASAGWSMALSEHRLRAVTGNHPENPTLDLPCREVFESGQRRPRWSGRCWRTKPRRCTPASGIGVSRTRCGILHAAPQSRDRTKRRVRYGPGSAAHRFASATRCAAIRGTDSLELHVMPE